MKRNSNKNCTLQKRFVAKERKENSTLGQRNSTNEIYVIRRNGCVWKFGVGFFLMFDRKINFSTFSRSIGNAAWTRESFLFAIAQRIVTKTWAGDPWRSKCRFYNRKIVQSPNTFCVHLVVKIYSSPSAAYHPNLVEHRSAALPHC